MRQTDLSLTVSQRKLPCVLDPTLLLRYAYGPTLAVRLTRVFEPWLTRSFWQVIDASDLLARGLELRANAGHDAARVQLDSTALATWIAMRDSTDAGSWSLRWMGDCLAESQVRDGAEPDLLERYESLLGALCEQALVGESHSSTWADGLDPVMGALDTLALSASLDGALILCPIDTSGEGTPWPAQALERSGVSVKRLDPVPPGTLFAAERQWVRDALVTAGLASVSWRLPRLAVVHVFVEMPAHSEEVPQPREDEPLHNPWRHARAWWYPVVDASDEVCAHALHA